jgi:pilus assembly protein CpaE
LARRVLIVSPNIEFTTYLEQELEGVAEDCELETLDSYPKADDIQDLLGFNLPLAVLVGFSDPNAALSTIRRLLRARPGLSVIAVHNEADAKIDRAALEAGAQDSFAPPMDVERLKARVFGAGPALDPNRAPGALLAFVPARGGDGASTLALHVAQALSRIGAADNPADGATLFVDFDFHAGASAFRLKLNQGPSVLDALRLGERLERGWRGLPTRWNGLDLLVGPDAEPNPPPGLFEGISRFVGFLRRSYRFIVVDMPPAFYASSRDVLRLADWVFVVHTPEVVSRAHADRRAEDILGLGLEPSRVMSILNRADSKTPRTVDGVFLGHGLQQFAAVRNDYGVLSDAERGGRLAGEETSFGEDVRDIARMILELS